MNSFFSGYLADKLTENYNKKRLGYRYLKISNTFVMKVHSTYDVKLENGKQKITIVKGNIRCKAFSFPLSVKDDKAIVTNYIENIFKAPIDSLKYRYKEGIQNNCRVSSFFVDLDKQELTIRIFTGLEEKLFFMVLRKTRINKKNHKIFDTMMSSISEKKRVENTLRQEKLWSAEMLTKTKTDTYKEINLSEENKKRYKRWYDLHVLIFVFFMLLPIVMNFLFIDHINNFLGSLYSMPDDGIYLTDYLKFGVLSAAFMLLMVVILTMIEKLFLRDGYRNFIAYNIPNKRYLQTKTIVSEIVGILIFIIPIVIMLDSFTVIEEDGIDVNSYSTIGNVVHYSYSKAESFDISFSKDNDTQDIEFGYTLIMDGFSKNDSWIVNLSDEQTGENKYSSLTKRLDKFEHLYNNVDSSIISYTIDNDDSELSAFIYDYFDQFQH